MPTSGRKARIPLPFQRTETFVDPAADTDIPGRMRRKSLETPIGMEFFDWPGEDITHPDTGNRTVGSSTTHINSLHGMRHHRKDAEDAIGRGHLQELKVKTSPIFTNQRESARFKIPQREQA
jgi:hypothetical protein